MKIIKLQIKSIFISLLAGLFLSSCLVQKPEGGIGSEDYNGRINVSGAYFIKKHSGTGAVVKLGAAGVGAVLAEQNSVATYYDDKQKLQKNTVVNVIVGAAIGFGITSLFNWAAGQDKDVFIRDADKRRTWVNKQFDNNYVILAEKDNFRSFRVINGSRESVFEVKNLADVQDFVAAFPNSSNKDRIVKQCIGNSGFNRTDLVSVLELLPNTSYSLEVKRDFLIKSNTVLACIDVKDKFPELYADSEKKAAGIITTVSETENFKAAFPNSTYANEIVGRTIGYVSRNYLIDLVDLYPNVANATVAKKTYIEKSNSLVDFFEAINRYPNEASDVKNRSLNLISGFDDAKRYVNKFGRDEYQTKVFQKALKFVQRNEIPPLISYFSSIDSVELVAAKLKYVEKSTTIGECKNASNLYSEVFYEADKKAYQLSNSIITYSQYINEFATGNNLFAAKNACRNALWQEFDKLKTKSYWERETSFSNYITNYKDAYDVDGLVTTVKFALQDLQSEMAKHYNNLDNIRNGFRLVTLKFQVPNGQFASAYLKKVEDLMQDLKSGRIIKDDIIVGIQNSASKGNTGIIHATWYRSGVTHEDIFSKNEGFPAFQSNIAQHLKNNGISLYSCNYDGGREDDDARQREAQAIQQEYQAKEDRKDARIEQAKKGDCDACFNKIEFKTYDRGNGGFLGCKESYTYKEYNFTCLNGKDYVIYYVNHTGKWAISDGDCEGSFNTLCELVIDLCKCEER